MRDLFYQVPKNKKVRVIIDTDTYAEGDDQFAIVHALLTPKFEVLGIVAEHFGKRFDNTMEKSYEEIKRLLTKMGREEVPVYRGELAALGEIAIGEDGSISGKDGSIPNPSEGVQFIIEQAKKEDDRPLFVLNMGAITNLAKAIQVAPEIQELLTAIWIGGGPYDGAIMDFNCGNDVKAANVVLGSKVELWQIPMSAYTMMEVSFFELYDRVFPYGEVGRYLVDNLLRVSDVECAMTFEGWPMFDKASKAEKTMIIRSGEGWSLGDSPAVGVLITGQNKHQEKLRARYIEADGSYGAYVSEDRMIRVYHSVDSRVILEDFYAKLKYFYSKEN